jgi:hypothetical protein
MNLDIDALQTKLMSMDLSTQKLAAIALIAFVILIFSVRALIRWYLGIEGLSDEFKLVRRQLNEIQIKLAVMSALKEDASPEESTAAVNEPLPPAKTETFRLLH